MKVCATPGCPQFTKARHCPDHTPSAAQRGYGYQHQQRRRSYSDRMARGERFTCWRCDKQVTPFQSWDVGHDDYDRTIVRGPEHTACNRATSPRRQGG